MHDEKLKYPEKVAVVNVSIYACGRSLAIIKQAMARRRTDEIAKAQLGLTRVRGGVVLR
jgi:hypothetical protein